MNAERKLLCCALCVVLIGLLCAQAWGAQVIKGTLLESPLKTGLVRIQTESGTLAISTADNLRVMRGQVGKSLREAQLGELASGDWIVAAIDSDDLAISLKGYFNVVQGTVEKAGKGVLTIKGTGDIKISSTPQVILPSGKPGKPSDIIPGASIVCRTNPVTKQAWTIAAIVIPDVPPKKPTILAKARPHITAIKYAAPDPTKPGDMITVNLEGTPGGKASIGVKNLIYSRMSEVTPGSYIASVRTPRDKTVHDAALVGYLSVGSAEASPVQASKLITVDNAEKEPAPVVTIKPVEPVKPAAPVATPAQPPPPTPSAPAKIIIKSPQDGARLIRSIMVKGSAEPNSKVEILITYANGLSGLLKLAGRVASQTLAVGKNGEFALGPIGLEGPLATKGLRFTIKAYYPDRSDHSTSGVVVYCDRE